MKSIVILGGTFNPVHKTHSYILDKAYKQLNACCKYYLINNIPPHKKISNITNKHRLEMLQIQAKLDNSKIIDYELKQDKISYTYDTIKYLKNKNPDIKIYFLIGGDNVLNLHSWYKIEKLVKMVTFIGVLRKGIKPVKNEFNIEYINVNLSSTSSTKIRSGQYFLCSKPVQQYILKNNLYSR